MQVKNTHELSLYMDQLKEWARKHQHHKIVDEIAWAETHGHTASELILKYAEALEKLRKYIPENLPPTYREAWEQAIKVARSGVETVRYEEKKRSIFSLG